MKQASVISLTILLICFILSCDSGKDQLQQKVVNSYVNILIAKDTLDNKSKEFQKIKSNIFKANEITDSEYEQYFEKMKLNPQLWDSFFDKANALLDTLKKKNNVR